jgi:hypothetical protein
VPGSAPAAPPGPLDHNLHQVRALLQEAETSRVAIILVGDSRSSGFDNRVQGAIYRHWDLPWAALHAPASGGAIGMNDGLGQFLIDLGASGIEGTNVEPGAVLLGAGLINRYPVGLAEQWTGPAPSGTPHFGVHTVVQSTAGGIMWSNAAGAGGGTFKRGNPALGRAIASIEYFAVADGGPRASLSTLLEAGYGGTFFPIVHAAVLPPPVGSAGWSIVPQVVMGNGSSGDQVYWRLRHTALPDADTGHVWIGTRLNFEGQTGCLLGIVAQGGWSTSDHLPQSVYNPGDNWDWKYSDARYQEWYQTCIRADKALLRVEIGANQNSIGGNFQEWNGFTTGNFRHHVSLLVDRALGNLAASGADRVVVQLVAIWQSFGDSPERVDAINTDLRSLAVERGWAFYDQQGHLIAGGHTDPGGSLRSMYRFDSAHQNFNGMNLLGELEWAAIQSAAAPCYANCDAGTVPPVLNVEDFSCFINRFAEGSLLPHAQQVEHYANCDGSTAAPVLNVEDFTCFINRFAAGCP